MIFTWGSSVLLYLCIYRLTGHYILAFMGGASWFLIPGNIFLLLTLEDNVWANFFNTLYIFLILTLTGYISTKKIPFSLAIGHSIIVGLCLSIGINIHQQLVPLVYSFPVAVWLSQRFTAKQTGMMTGFMLFGYILGSLLQNYAAYKQYAFIGIVQRLWHQPYTDVFSNLWYFSSGKSPVEWLHLIFLGLSQSFLSNVISTPKVFYVLICVSFLGLILLIARGKNNSEFWHNEAKSLLLVIMSLILIHVPHSLLYEPWIVERWDSTFPGLIILVSYSVYLFIRFIPYYRKTILNFKSSFVASLLIFIVFLYSIGNAKDEINALMAGYRNQPSNVALQQTRSFLKNRQHVLDKFTFIFVDPILQQYDNQALLSYYYPQANIISFNEHLNILYTSDHFHHINTHNQKTIKNIEFPDNAKIIAMANPVLWLSRGYPEFLNDYEIIEIQ